MRELFPTSNQTPQHTTPPPSHTPHTHTQTVNWLNFRILNLTHYSHITHDADAATCTKHIQVVQNSSEFIFIVYLYRCITCVFLNSAKSGARPSHLTVAMYIAYIAEMTIKFSLTLTWLWLWLYFVLFILSPVALLVPSPQYRTLP